MNDSADRILDFAIAREEDAYRFYSELAAKVQRSAMKEVFTQFAAEELGHKRKLQEVKQGGKLTPSSQQVQDLKIADYTAGVEPDTATDYQSALIVAMKREKASFKLYTELARKVTDSSLKKLFAALAQEEAKHKLRFEIEYDDLLAGGN